RDHRLLDVVPGEGPEVHIPEVPGEDLEECGEVGTDGCALPPVVFRDGHGEADAAGPPVPDAGPADVLVGDEHGPGDAEQVLGPVGDRTGQVVPAGDAALLFLKGFLADLSPAGITRPVSSGAAPPQEMVGTGHATAPSSPVISSVIRPSTLPTARGTS